MKENITIIRHAWAAFTAERNLDGKVLRGSIDPALSFSDDILTTFFTYPDFVKSFGLNIDPCARAKHFLLWFLIFGVGNGKFAVKDQVGRETIVAMRRIICVVVISPCEDVAEP